MLRKNAALEEIATKLSPIGPNWPEVVDRFKRTNTFRAHTYDGGLLYSSLSRIITRVSLEQVKKTMGNTLVLDPIRSGSSTRGFTFLQKDDGLYVECTPIPYVRLDEVILVEDLPVLIETRLDPFGGRRGRNRRFNQSRDSEEGMVNMGAINGLLKPITSLFIKPFNQSECGYVFITAPEHCDPQRTVFSSLSQAGGIMVPFYTSRDAFRAEVCGMRKKHDF